MMDPKPPQKDPAAPQTIIWGALLFAVLLYGVVGHVIRGSQGAPAEEPSQILLWAFLGIAAMETGMALFLAGLLPGLLPMQRNLLRWALCESIAILGLVLFLLGASKPIFLGFLGWSALLLLSLRPAGGEEKRVS